VEGLLRRWHSLGDGVDVDRASNAEVEALLDGRMDCRRRMVRARSRKLAELRMKLALVHGELADNLDADRAEDAVNLALLGSALADLTTIETTN
jgi:hypothetical protein